MKTLEKAFNGRQVRVIIQKGVEWFVAKDVCECLGLENVSRAMSSIPDKEKDDLTIRKVDANGLDRAWNMLCVNEPGLYRLIFKSRLDVARQFQDWVFEEVLPSIRKTGKYDVRDIKAKSTDNRKAFTTGLQRQGLTSGHEYAEATRYEYKVLYDDPCLHKADMSRDQILVLSALEAVEALKYSRLPPDILKLSGVKQSIGETAGLLEEATRPRLSA